MLGYKVYETVIMDGSDTRKNAEIIGIIDMVTRRNIGRSKGRKLSKSYPSMVVIRRFTSAEKYRQAKRLIERNYPGLCSFDVDMRHIR